MDGIEAVFCDDALVVDGPLTRSRLSPSVAKAMHGCTARWALEQILDRVDDPFGAAEQGTAAHWVLEQLYGLEPAGRTLGAAAGFLQQAADGACPEIVLPAPAELPAWFDSVWELVAPAFEAEDPASVDVAGRELAMGRASVAGVPFRGIIDRLDRLDGGALRVCDYKTSRKGAKDARFRERFGDAHGDQARMYALALESMGERVDASRIVYTATGQVYDVSMAPRDLARIADEFAESWRVLHRNGGSGVWPTVPGPLCGWCPGCTVCPAAAKAGRGEPKVPAGWAAEKAGVGVGSAPHTKGSPGGRGGRPADQEREIDMTGMFSERKRWEEQDADGRLNGDSPAAMAAFGLSVKATELLHGAGQPLTRSTVTAMARTLAHVVDTVQADVYGHSSLMAGINTRLRGALWSAVEQFPVPFGGTVPEWDAWVVNVTRRTRSIAVAAFELWSNGPGMRPWEALAVTDPDPAGVPVAEAVPAGQAMAELAAN